MIRFLLATVLLAACSESPPAPAATPAAPPPAAAPAEAAPAPAETAGAAAPAATAVRDIDVATLKADLDKGAVPLLIDVRTPAEYADGHVPGAKNVPLDELDTRIGELGGADKEVYVICQSGGRSARASAALAAKGLRPVNVTGGTGAWKAASLPVEK